MCSALGVAPGGHYRWLQRPSSNRAIKDARLLRLIRASLTARQGIYDAHWVFLELPQADVTHHRHCVERRMRESGLRRLHGYRDASLGHREADHSDLEPLEAPVFSDAPERRLGDRHRSCAQMAGLTTPGVPSLW